VGNWLILSRYLKIHVGSTFDQCLFRYFKVNRSVGRRQELRHYKVIGAVLDVKAKKLSVVYPDGSTSAGSVADFVLMALSIPPPYFDVKATSLIDGWRTLTADAWTRLESDRAADGDSLTLQSWVPKNYVDILMADDPRWEFVTHQEIFQMLYDTKAGRFVKLKSMLMQPITSRFVYTLKVKMGIVTRGCRWTPHGFAEIPNVHFNPDEIFAASPQLYSIRYLCAIAASSGRKIWHLDCKRAFSTTPFKDGKLICVRLPKGYEVFDADGDECGIELFNSVYGLKESNQDWEERFRTVMYALKFRNSVQAVTVYVSCSFILLVWVDDIFCLPSLGTVEPEAAVAQLVIDLEFHLKSKVVNLGVLQSALGIEFEWLSDGSVSLNQERYIDATLLELDLEDITPRRLPVEPNFSLSTALATPLIGPTFRLRFCSITGKILWANRCIFPQISHAVNLCSRYTHAATEGMMAVALGVVGYLKYAKAYRLTYSRYPAGGIGEILEAEYGYDSSTIVGFCDSEFRARQPDDDRIEKRCYNFAVIMFCGAAVDWRITVTKRVTLSAVEAELCALSRLCQLLVASVRIFKELGISPVDFYPIRAFSDSKGAIHQGNHPVANTQLIHVDNREYFCRELKILGHVEFRWISRKVNCADVGTHVIADAVLFEKFTAFMLNTGPILWSRSLNNE